MSFAVPRRAVLASALGLLARPALAMPGRGGASVVIVGGGFGGATAARMLRRSDPELRITLIEPGRSHLTCPFSNTVIGGFNAMSLLDHGFERLQNQLGIKILRDTATIIDPSARQVRTAGGGRIAYDRLLVSPGIDMRWNALEGYDEAAAEIMPHAWKAGPQTLALRNRLEAMEDGGLVVLSVPGNPYRCPPGPYERAGLIAWYLSKAKPRSKVMILDAKDSFSKQALFLEGWKALYGDMVEWVPAGQNGRVVRVDARAGMVETDFDRLTPAVTNIIPPQTAGRLAVAAGLTDSSGFCPVDPVSFESSLIPGIYVIGDSCIAGEMPKSASSANNQAKIAAASLMASLRGRAPVASNALNVCYSLLAPDYGISVAWVYEVAHGRRANVDGAGGVSPLGADAHTRKAEADFAAGWYASICAEAWG